jgi:multisubunit Na+/H+ antiporter MnhE subunit
MSKYAKWSWWILESLVWWVLCIGVWLVSLSAVAWQELIVAALAALPCGVLATLARVVAGNAWRLRPAWLGPLALLPVAIVTDTAQVLWAAVRRRPVEFSEKTLAQGRGENSLAAGRRALATLILSASPGTFVTDTDVDSGSVLVHKYAWRGPQLDEVLSR